MSLHLVGAGNQLLEPPAVRGPAVGHFLVGGDDEVVKVDVRSHGPQLQAHGPEGGHLERVQVLEEVRVRDLTRAPHTLRGEGGGFTGMFESRCSETGPENTFL